MILGRVFATLLMRGPHLREYTAEKKRYFTSSLLGGKDV